MLFILRKIDLIIQLIAFVFLVVLLITMNWMGFAVSLYLYGFWQGCSALLNTWSFIKSPYKQKIKIYWILTCTDLLILFMSSNTELIRTTLWGELLVYIAFFGALGIAAWYLFSYQLLIQYIDYKKEMTGVIK